MAWIFFRRPTQPAIWNGYARRNTVRKDSTASDTQNPIDLHSTVFRPFFDHHGRIVHLIGSNCRRKDIKQQGRTRPTGSMLRKPFISTSQPSTNRFGPRRLAFAYPHALLSQARREHGHPCRWTPVRPHTFTGMVRSDWFMVGTRDVVTACRNVLSRSRRILSRL